MPEAQDLIMTHKSYRYKVAALELLSSELPEPVKFPPAAVTHMFMEKNYDEAFYPVLRLDLALNPKLKDFIVVNKNKIEFRLRFQSVAYNTSTNSPEEEKDVINAIFIPMLEDTLPYMEDSDYDEVVDMLGTNPNGTENIDKSKNLMSVDHNATLEMYLFVKDHLNNSKNLVNIIYSNTTVREAIVSLLSKNGFNHIVMTQPENNDSQQIIIPPMNLLNIFHHLQETYGIYHSGVINFFDHDRVYVMAKSGHPNCVANGEYPKTVFDVYPSNKSMSRTSGTFDCPDKQEWHMEIDPKGITMTNTSAYHDQISGNSKQLINSYKNSSSFIGSAGEQAGEGTGNARVDYNIDSNEYLNMEHAHRVNEMKTRARLVLYDVNIAALTPNKEFIVNWVDSKTGTQHNGYYRPMVAKYEFNRQGEELMLTAIFDMTKKEETAEQAIGASQETYAMRNPVVDTKSFLALLTGKSAGGGISSMIKNATSGIGNLRKGLDQARSEVDGYMKKINGEFNKVRGQAVDAISKESKKVQSQKGSLMQQSGRSKARGGSIYDQIGHDAIHNPEHGWDSVRNTKPPKK